MTSALAKLLRQSISNDNERIPLEKEVDYAGSYLTIQKMRYKDKLEYEIEVAEDIKKEEIINLILQPWWKMRFTTALNIKAPKA